MEYKFSDFRKKIKELYLDIYFKIRSIKMKKGDKIFLTSTDGIGDNVVRQKILSNFLKKYGPENVIILCKEKVKPFLTKIGYTNIIVYSDEYRKRCNKKIQLISKISQLGIQKIISLEFDQHDIFIKYLIDVPKIGYTNNFNNWIDQYYNELVRINKNDYIMISVKKMYEYLFDTSITFEEIHPNIEEFYNINKNLNIITFGIGSADRKKMLSVDKVNEILNILRELFPAKDIIILGKGELETKFENEYIEKFRKDDKIIFLINKISFEEIMKLINSSILYIGVDSGLYNLAFGLKKNVVAFFAQKNTFSHDIFENVEIIYGKNKHTQKKEYYFGCMEINNIDGELIKEKLKKYAN